MLHENFKKPETPVGEESDSFEKVVEEIRQAEREMATRERPASVAAKKTRSYSPG